MDPRAVRRAEGRLWFRESFGREDLVLVALTLAATVVLGAIAAAAFAKAASIGLLCSALALGCAAAAGWTAFRRRGWEIDRERGTAASVVTWLGRSRAEVHRLGELEAVELQKQAGVVGGLTIVRWRVALVGAPANLPLAITGDPVAAAELGREVAELTGLPLREPEP